MANEKNNIPIKIYLSEAELPKQWYNVKADMKEQHAPFLNPATLKPVTFINFRYFYYRTHMQELTKLIGILTYQKC